VPEALILEHKVEIAFTNEQLLQLLVTVINAELLEAVSVQYLEPVYVQNADNRSFRSDAVAC